MTSMRNRCPRGLGVAIPSSSSEYDDDDQPDSPGTPDAMVSPHIFDRNAAMEMLHTPKTTRRLRRKKAGGPCGTLLKVVGGLVALVVVAGGCTAGLVAAGVVAPDSAAATWAVGAAGRASCRVFGDQKVPGADPCPKMAAAGPPDAKTDEAALLENQAALAAEAKHKREAEERKKRHDADRKALTPPSHVKMLFRNTRDDGDLSVYTISHESADYHSKLAPGEEHTYYIAREQVLEFRHGAASTADPYWRARVKPFVTIDDEDDDETGAAHMGLVFENTMGEHIAVEFAKEGFWLEPKKKTAYNAEEGHAFSLSDVQRTPRFACSVYGLDDDELASLAKKSKEREDHLSAKAKSDAAAAKRDAEFEAAKRRAAAAVQAPAQWTLEQAEAERKLPHFKRDDAVEAMGRSVDAYVPGKIRGGPWDDGTYDIDYDDGRKDTRVVPPLIRKAAPKPGPPAPAAPMDEREAKKIERAKAEAAQLAAAEQAATAARAAEAAKAAAAAEAAKAAESFKIFVRNVGKDGAPLEVTDAAGKAATKPLAAAKPGEAAGEGEFAYVTTGSKLTLRSGDWRVEVETYAPAPGEMGLKIRDRAATPIIVEHGGDFATVATGVTKAYAAKHSEFFWVKETPATKEGRRGAGVAAFRLDDAEKAKAAEALKQ